MEKSDWNVICWRTVFNSTHKDWWGNQSVARLKAEECGYPYYTWNDRIYRTVDSFDLELLISEIETQLW